VNIKKPYFFALFSLILSACGGNKHPYPDKFVILTEHIPLDTAALNTVLYNTNYYTLKEDYKFVFFTNKLEVDSEITRKISQQEFHFTFVRKDTLIAGKYNMDFSTENYYLDKDFTWKFMAKGPINQIIFEDETYEISSCCTGEFGGSIFFKEKRTGKMYSCPATCPASVNKMNGIYYLSISLSHLHGRSSILQISDPKQLKEIHSTSTALCTWWDTCVTYKDSFKGMDSLMRGTIPLYKGRKSTIVLSFVYNNQLYHLNSKNDITYISRLICDTLQPVDTLANYSIRFGHGNYSSKTPTYQRVTSIYDLDQNGFIEQRHDTIFIRLFTN